MSNTKLDFVKTYIINAIFFVLAYSFPFIGIVLLKTNFLEQRIESDLQILFQHQHTTKIVEIYS